MGSNALNSSIRILFLDVDGVLNWKGTWGKPWYGEKQEGFCHLEPSCCELYHKIVKELDLTVVLSSTWRLNEITKDYLLQRGILEYIHPVDPYTPSTTNPKYYLRGFEIDEWMKRHPEIHQSRGFAILDDNEQFLPYQRKRFVQTSFKYGGLQEKHLRKLRGFDWASL